MPHRRIILPLDVPNIEEGRRLTQLLWNNIGVLKIGLQLFLAEGPKALEAVERTDLDVFLDLKLHDIPATVAQAVKSAAKHKVRFLTVHTSGGPAMLKAAAEVAPPDMTLLGVTALTSLGDDDLHLMGIEGTVGKFVANLADMAWNCGIRGFVCSPLEVKVLRDAFPEATLVVPGIRPAKADDDQKRVATPAKAMEDGASYLVIGRPIRAASDPVAAAKAIADEIAPWVK